MSDNRNFLPMLGGLLDKTAYYNPYPGILSTDYRVRNYVENIYRDKLRAWYPNGLPDMYSNPSDLSHLIGSDDYYPARHVDHSLRRPMRPVIDYYPDYGYKYANRFKYQTRQRLSPQGQRWVDSTFVYLQRKMEEELYRNPDIELYKDIFKSFAFDTHPEAYIKSGFFCLQPSDLIEIGTAPDFKDMLTPNGVIQFYRILQEINTWLPREVYNRRFGKLENYLLDTCYILDKIDKLW